MEQFRVSFGGSVPDKVVAGTLLQSVGGSEEDIQSKVATWRQLFVRVEATNAQEAISAGEAQLTSTLGDELKSPLVPVSVEWTTGGDGWPEAFCVGT
jgi:hypothetical protein